MRQVVAAESRITVYGSEGEVVRCPLNSCDAGDGSNGPCVVGDGMAGCGGLSGGVFCGSGADLAAARKPVAEGGCERTDAESYRSYLVMRAGATARHPP